MVPIGTSRTLKRIRTSGTGVDEGVTLRVGVWDDEGVAESEGVELGVDDNEGVVLGLGVGELEIVGLELGEFEIVELDEAEIDADAVLVVEIVGEMLTVGLDVELAVSEGEGEALGCAGACTTPRKARLGFGKMAALPLPQQQRVVKDWLVQQLAFVPFQT